VALDGCFMGLAVGIGDLLRQASEQNMAPRRLWLMSAPQPGRAQMRGLGMGMCLRGCGRKGAGATDEGNHRLKVSLPGHLEKRQET
jgi:hypothetical protein